jgi:hypothetical protein
MAVIERSTETPRATEIAEPTRELGRIAWKWMVTTDH